MVAIFAAVVILTVCLWRKYLKKSHNDKNQISSTVEIQQNIAALKPISNTGSSTLNGLSGDKEQDSDDDNEEMYKGIVHITAVESNEKSAVDGMLAKEKTDNRLLNDPDKIENHEVIDTMDGGNAMDDENYQNWDHKQIIEWILSLENGLFVMYKDVLEQRLLNWTGENLMNVSMDDINSWGINDYQYVKLLHAKIKELTNVEGNA